MTKIRKLSLVELLIKYILIERLYLDKSRLGYFKNIDFKSKYSNS